MIDDVAEFHGPLATQAFRSGAHAWIVHPVVITGQCVGGNLKRTHLRRVLATIQKRMLSFRANTSGVASRTAKDIATDAIAAIRVLYPSTTTPGRRSRASRS